MCSRCYKGVKGVARDTITKTRMIIPPWDEKCADSAEAANEMRLRWCVHINVCVLTKEHPATVAHPCRSKDRQGPYRTHPVAMAVLSEQILAAAALRPEGSLLAAKQFLALGQRDAVDQALRRLAARGKLVKITRGRYALPVCRRFGTRPSAPELVIDQLMACPGFRLCGAAALAWCQVKNALPMDERGLCFEAVVAAVAADGLLVILVPPAVGACFSCALDC